MASETVSDLDVLIVGAGISGIGCGCYLTMEMPEKSFRIVEARDSIGGTWDLFRYPGIRSDSDLYTFAYEFKPWEGENAIAQAADIRGYLDETVDEYGLRDRITLNRRVNRLSWDSAAALWTAEIVDAETGTTETLRCRWVFMAAGYYNYAHGHRPEFPDEDSFAGRIIHPQHWPDDLDHAGKTIAVIGSGATAVTLIPELAKTAAHVTQIQRTPSYVMSLPARDGLAQWLARHLSAQRAHSLTRTKNIWIQHVFVRVCQRFPGLARRLITSGARRQLPDGFPVDVHFAPPYDPWDQRLCLAPDGDYFKALASGAASIVTGDIARFTPRGVQMASGEDIEADIIVTATGLTVQLAGGIRIAVDGKLLRPAEHLVFRGALLDNVPNLILAIGYTTSSWTLKIGLICKYFLRLLRAAEETGAVMAVAKRPPEPYPTRPLLDFGAGYVRRAIDGLPKQGAAPPWEMSFGYVPDSRLLARTPIPEPGLELRAAGTAAAGPAE